MLNGHRKIIRYNLYIVKLINNTTFGDCSYI